MGTFSGTRVCFECSNPVSALNVAPGGETILIGTIKGDLEICKTKDGGGAQKQNVWNITALLDEKKFGINNTYPKDSSLDTDTNNVAPETPQRPTSVTISSFHFASHRTIEDGGFVTLHYIHGKGAAAWVFIWQKKG